MGEQRGSVLGDQPVSVDEWRRLEALKLALRYADTLATSADIVQDAGRYEAYLKGGSDE